MKIAPIDIAHKTFDRKLMGLDAEAVHQFLRAVADQMEDLIRERNNLKEALREKELSILEYKERDESLKNTIATATRMSEKIQADAEREAKLIINDAHQKADAVMRDSRDSLKRMYQELADMKKIRMQFEQNLKALVKAHLELIEQAHQWMPTPSMTTQSTQMPPAASPEA
jgi:cell division initiation protein